MDRFTPTRTVAGIASDAYAAAFVATPADASSLAALHTLVAEDLTAPCRQPAARGGAGLLHARGGHAEQGRAAFRGPLVHFERTLRPDA